MSDVGINDYVYYPVLRSVLDNCSSSDEIKKELIKNIHDLIPKYITTDDIFSIISYILGLNNGIGYEDDIDHLGNRRLRSVGELLQNQFRVGLVRMERNIKRKNDVYRT